MATNNLISPPPISNAIASQNGLADRNWQRWFSQVMEIVGRLQGGKLLSIQEYADNAAAIAAGLSVGSIYRTGDALKIVH